MDSKPSEIVERIRNWNREQERQLQWYIDYGRAREQAREQAEAAAAPPQPVGLLGLRVDPPTEMESIGRGVMDVWEPVKQGYLNVTDQARAQTYRQQRADDERLYNVGLLGRAQRPGERVPVDTMRMQGRLLPLAPFMMRSLSAPPAEALASQMLSVNALDALNILRKRLGLME